MILLFTEPPIRNKIRKNSLAVNVAVGTCIFSYCVYPSSITSLRFDKNIFPPKMNPLSLLPFSLSFFLSFSLSIDVRNTLLLYEDPRHDIVVINAHGNAFFQFYSVCKGS